MFMRNMDPQIARATWQIFKPAIPTTVEGLVYAAVGMFVLLTIYHAGVRYPISRIARARRTRRRWRTPTAMADVPDAASTIGKPLSSAK